mgnify:FL=1
MDSCAPPDKLSGVSNQAAIDTVRAELVPRLRRLHACLAEVENWIGVDFARETIASLQHADSERDLQHVFTVQLGASGPLAIAAGFPPTAVALLDDILATAQQLAMTFAAPTHRKH